MLRLFQCALLSGIFAGSVVVAAAQSPAQNMVSTSTSTKSPDAHEAIEPIGDDVDNAIDPASLLPDLPNLPPAKATLMGGTIQKLDRIQDALTIQVFGGGKEKIFFDPRTHIYLGTALGSTADLRQGDRVYVDTILDGSTVFAKSIRLRKTAVAGQSQGIVSGFREDKQELTLRDAISPRPLKVRLTSGTKIVHGDRSVSASELVPGTLVNITFGPQEDGGDVAREISVLAVPGGSFTFAGRVTGLDLRLGLLVITSSTDHKTYEIYFNPALLPPDQNLRESAQVTIQTRFDGNRYVARSVTVNSPSQP